MKNEGKYKALCEKLDKEYNEFIGSLQTSDNPSVVAKVFKENALNIFICDEIIYHINEYGTHLEDELSEKEFDTLLKLDNTLLTLCYGQIDYGQAELSFDNMISNIGQFSKALSETDELLLNTGSRDKSTQILNVITKAKNEEKLDFNLLFTKKLQEEHNCKLIWNNGKYNIFSSDGNKIGSYKLWDLPYTEGEFSLNYNNYPLITPKIRADYDDIKTGVDTYNSAKPFPKSKAFAGLDNFRNVATINGVVLGVTYEEMFNRFTYATWNKSVTGGVCNGHYSMDFKTAMTDFNYRSQMIPSDSILGTKDVENILHSELCQTLPEETYANLCSSHQESNKQRINANGYWVYHDIIPLSTEDVKTLVANGDNITLEQYQEDGLPHSINIKDIDVTTDFIGGIKKEIYWDYEDFHTAKILPALLNSKENSELIDLTFDDFSISR